MRFAKCRVPVLALGWAAMAPAGAAGLPDTGVDHCYDNSTTDAVAANSLVSIARDGGSFPRQDCRYGADAAAVTGSIAKTGAGAKGFDYTKIANNGTALAAGAALGSTAGAWACTRDNITGLTWEVRTAAPNTDLRYQGHTYAWFNADGTTNGGNPGSLGNTASCNSTLPACQTQNYRIAVNAATLCGASDWRLPTPRELQTLVHFGNASPAIDLVYFPDVISGNIWTSASDVADASRAWAVDFTAGTSDRISKASVVFIRLVRGTPF